jgi:hypothetical protein
MAFVCGLLNADVTYARVTLLQHWRPSTIIACAMGASYKLTHACWVRFI